VLLKIGAGRSATQIGFRGFVDNLIGCDMLHFFRLPKGPLLDAKPTIIAVAEIVLNVRDLPAMRDFYRTVLGFELLSEACHETGPEPDAEGKPTIAFLTVQALDTPLGRHGHPQLLALIDFRRHIFAKGNFLGHEPNAINAESLGFRDSARKLRSSQTKTGSLRSQSSRSQISSNGREGSVLQ